MGEVVKVDDGEVLPEVMPEVLPVWERFPEFKKWFELDPMGGDRLQRELEVIGELRYLDRMRWGRINERYGLPVWEFLQGPGAHPKAVEVFKRVKERLAEDLMLETVDIADGTDPDWVGVSKLRTERREKLLRGLARGNWVDEKGEGNVGPIQINIIHESA